MEERRRGERGKGREGGKGRGTRRGEGKGKGRDPTKFREKLTPLICDIKINGQPNVKGNNNSSSNNNNNDDNNNNISTDIEKH